MRDGDALIYAPGVAEPMWVAARPRSSRSSPAARSSSKPIRPSEREGERPWDKAKRTHWFWSEVWKVRREFWPVLLAALIVNLLALAMPLFTMNVYDRVIPNKAVSTLWVLAIGVGAGAGVRLHPAPRAVAAGRRDRPQARRQAVAEAVRKGDEPADGRAPGQHRRLCPARLANMRWSATSSPRPRVVLVVDVVFLFLFLVLITVLAGWLVMVPIVGIALMLVAGISLQKAMGRAALDAQADSSLQHSRAGRIDRRHRDAEGGARRRPDARPLAALFGDVGGDPGAHAPADRGRRQPRQRVAAADQRRPADRRLLPCSTPAT